MLSTNPEASAGQIRVLIADNHVTVLEGLAAIINRQLDMKVVAEASDGLEAAELWARFQPDVSLLDLRMPGLDGVDVINTIMAQSPAARIVVLTTFDTDNDIFRAIKAGAKAYLLKDIRREELIDCIRRVHAGESYIPSALGARLASGMSKPTMTAREQEVLRMLAHGKSNKEIGARLYITETTVKTHLRSIFSKLNVNSRTEAISVATKRGLIKL